MKYLNLVWLSLLLGCTENHEITGIQLLDSAIEYHDPEGSWGSFSGTFEIKLDMPDRPMRTSIVSIDLPNSFFKLEMLADQNQTIYELNTDTCKIQRNGKIEFTEEEKSKFHLTCDRAKKMKDYYCYLYGLPMKLKDKGTIIFDKVEQKAFKGKTYNVLKVMYEDAVGSDTWYFYFDITTNAMQAYQFFHDETINDGEYILLDGLLEFGAMKIPKNRTWYYNKDDKTLGEDKLKAISALN